MADISFVQKKTAVEWQALYDKAHATGDAAANAAQCSAMQVTDGKRVWHVPDGPCGFAWIKFAGNTPWARWAKAHAGAHNAYPTGYMIWVSDYNQSMQRKEAYAHAFATVLRDAGIHAYAASRMD